MTEVTFASLHEKMNFLLKDHGVENFDESDLDLESVSSLHAKANALCAAHGGDPPAWRTIPSPSCTRSWTS